MKRPKFLLTVLFIALLSVSYVVTFTFVSTVRAASVFSSLPNGYAFAGYVKVPSGSTVAGSGPVAPAWLGCTIQTRSVSNTVAALSLGTYGHAGTSQTTVTN